MIIPSVDQYPPEDPLHTPVMDVAGSSLLFCGMALILGENVVHVQFCYLHDFLVKQVNN
ncbi:hypothetical protein D3C81_2121300 [compost metagenome]